MTRKFLLWSAGIGGAVASFAVATMASASSFFTLPTSTASTLSANVGDQIGDAGTLLVIALAAGIPLAFYVIHRVIGLVPGSKGRK